MYQPQIREVNKNVQAFSGKRKTLQELDLFVLDNSLRETTVGQLRGHTIENKWAIYKEVKRIGFKHIIVGSFSHMTRVGETFIRQLKEAGEDTELMYSFTELVETYVNKIPQNDIPIALIKLKDLGIKNVIIECDLVYHGIDYKKFTSDQFCNLLKHRFDWIRNNLSRDARILVNLRDLPDCMVKKPSRLFKVINFISSLPPDEAIFGIVFEESGKYFPEELGVWTRAVRKEMDRCGFTSGHLLVHVHQQWGMVNSTQMECLANGANGIWAGLCEEGAAMGHACSCVTMMNLVRMGNQNVINNYNCARLRSAAQNVTQITTGKPAHPKQAIYGARSLDVVFGMDQFTPNSKEFSLAEFIGEEPVMRITTLASPGMITTRLTNLYGEHPDFTKDMANKMLEVMLQDLQNNRKEEYHSIVGLALLFDRSGGKLTAEMAEAIARVEPKQEYLKELIGQVRCMWDEWDLRDGEKDDQLDFDAFYNGFMSPYFGCYRCDETKRALSAIDMDCDGKVDWNEFAVYLKWAGNQYPDIATAEELLDVAFRKGLVPAMQDEVVKSLSNSDGQAAISWHYQYARSDDEDDWCC